jgi:hypothetical protein
LRYQHATEERDRVFAEALGQFADADVVPLRRTKDEQSSQPSADGHDARNQAKEEEQPQRGSNPCLHLERVVS